MIKVYKYIFILVILIVNASFCFSQNVNIGTPLIEYFGAQDYHAGIRNFAITQDSRGTILIANNKGMLTYDGSEWNNYQVGRGSRVRAVLPSANGRIYVGSPNEIGYFFPEQNGSYVYHSLNDLIPDSLGNFENIWDIFPTETGCIFSNYRRMFRYNGRTISIVEYPSLNTATFQLDDRIYKHVFDFGLMFYDKNKWQIHNQGKYFAKKDISSLISYGGDQLLISTHGEGIFLVSKNSIIPWLTSMQETFVKHKVNKVLALKNGLYAVGTNTNGVYIINTRGDLKHHFTSGKGLKNRTILDIFEDSFGNVWLGHNNGISKIELNSPFSYINEAFNLHGTGYVAQANKDYTYFGTNNGLYYYRNNQPEIANNFKKIEGIEGQVYNIQNINGDLLVSCHFGAYQINGIKPVEISNGPGWWGFAETDRPDIAIGGGYTGLFLLKKKNDIWNVSKHYPNFFESSRMMEFDDNGVLWMAHAFKGVFSIQFSENYEDIINIKFYGQDKGFPSNWFINVFKLKGENIFTTKNGVFVYNAKSDNFLKHQKYTKIFGADNHIRSISEDNFGNIYFIGENSSGMVKKNYLKYELKPSLFNNIHNILNNDLENITALDNGSVIFSANDGFIQYNTSFKNNSIGKFSTIFRSVVLTKSDSVLFGGNFVENKILVNTQPSDQVPKLNFRDNSISFSYSAIDFNKDPALYRYRLNGYGQEWSEWSAKTNKEYTNLYEGDYSFQLEAKNVFGLTSPIQEYSFIIQAPWYRTMYAYVLYVVGFVSVLFVIIFYNRSKNHLISQQEKELLHLDTDLKEVSRKSDEQINRLINEKLTSEIKHKKNEIANSTIHLIDKNNFLNSIKNHINQLLKEVDKQKTRYRLNRIIDEINKNIEGDKDWKQFEMHFNEVHEGFTKKLREKYPPITSQEVKLSAYLRMEMTTKEIANLLRISVRGVEMSRYRLRKKLDLDSNENLVDFMIRL